MPKTLHRRSAPSLFGPAPLRSTKGQPGEAPAMRLALRTLLCFAAESQCKVAARRAVA